MSQTQPFDFKARIEAAIREFVAGANSKDAARIARLYAEDATLLPPGSPPIKGRANIQAFWDAFIKAGATDAHVEMKTMETSGDYAYEIGAWQAVLTNPQTGAAGTVTGKYLVVWKRQPNNEIQMIADSFSPNA